MMEREVWMRVANIDMTLPGATCPNGLIQYDYGNIDQKAIVVVMA